MSNSPVARFADAIAAFSGSYAPDIFPAAESACSVLVCWTNYLSESQATGTSDVLLAGLRASMIESCSYLSAGLVRPAVFGIRAQIDIGLAWLFFKDHPVEWTRVEDQGDGYKLPSDVLKYLKAYHAKFEPRLKLLRSKRTSGEDDPYRLLSAHVHSQNAATIPPVSDPSDLIGDRGLCDDCIRLQGQVAEYLGDVFLSLFCSEWADLPATITEDVQTRLNDPELKDLCR